MHSERRRAPDATEASFDALAVARGERAFERALERTRALVAEGKTVVWGVDLDNALYDTRARTLAIGKDFDRAHGTTYFKDIEVEDMQRIGRDGAATATNLSMSPDDKRAFSKMWAREFWMPERVKHDVEIPDAMARAKAIIEAGGTLRYISGRAEAWEDEDPDHPTPPGEQPRILSFREDSLARIRASGLPAENENLILKPAPGGSTPAFKREELLALEALPNTVVAGFITDTLHELIAMRHVDTVPCFWVRTSFEMERHPATPPWVYWLPQVM